ncbi:MAG: lysylphosphatidylglycerol synthase transmembrane domain-containing protein [Saprospiraceae bacterium]
MNKNIKEVLKILSFLSIGLILLYIVYLKSESTYQAECILKGIAAVDCDFIGKILSDIKSANITWILIALSIYLISNIARALRWNMLLEPLGHKPKFINTIGILMVGYLTNLGIPRSGEFIKAGMMAKYEDFEPEKVMGTIVTDRILDVISLLIVIGITMVLSFNKFVGYFESNDVFSLGISRMFTLTNGLLFVLGMGILFVLLWKSREKLLNSKIGQKIKKILLGFWEGILTIKDVSHPVFFIVLSITIWICYFLMTYLMFFCFEPTSGLGPVAGLIVFVFGTLGIVIPTPGGIGTYQFLISEALQKLYGLEMSESFSFANILFFTVQFVNIILGIIMLVALPIYNKNGKEKSV